jgi:small-conductance mechanosensitive channel
METGIITSWPWPAQLAALAGAAVAGATMWFLGARTKKPEAEAPGEESEELRQLRAKLHNAEQRAADVEQKLDVAELRAQLEDVVRAVRESCFSQLGEVEGRINESLGRLEARVRTAERSIAVLEVQRSAGRR